MEELNERERLYKFFGLGGLVKCTKCGSNRRVIPNMTTRDSKCIDCFVKRRLKEVFGED